jgi:hypothetical protein
MQWYASKEGRGRLWRIIEGATESYLPSLIIDLILIRWRHRIVGIAGPR